MTFPYDEQLGELVAKDASSIDDVVTVLQAIDSLLDGDQDGLKWFNTLYLQVTLAVRDRVRRNDFADVTGSAFVGNLDFVFANLYFAALRAWLASDTAATPESWQLLFAARSNAALARLQFALVGVNAHINRDLAVAVAKLCRDSGVQPSHDTPQYQAYTAVNSTLDSLIEQAKRELMVSLPGDELPGADLVEQVTAAWGVKAARESAWVHAEILWAIADEAPLADRFIATLDGTAALAGKALLVVA